MYACVIIFVIVVSVFLILVIVAQNSKGGGLISGFTSANQIIGVHKTTDFFEKITWWLAGILVVLCIFASVFRHNVHSTSEDSVLKDDIMETIPQQQRMK